MVILSFNCFSEFVKFDTHKRTSKFSIMYLSNEKYSCTKLFFDFPICFIHLLVLKVLNKCTDEIVQIDLDLHMQDLSSCDFVLLM